tara:strand:+ start:321 stop:2018 length:1698 start_codon:yes stop_codon:yes gene_type:complete
MNKQEWDNSLMEHFAPKKGGLGLDLLMEMVREVMDSGVTLLSEEEKKRSMEELYKFLPQFEFSEMIGRPDDADIANKGEVRATFTSMMSGLGGESAELQDKINAVNAFVSAGPEEAKGKEAQEILRTLTFLRLLSVVVQDFTDAGAGFIFEAFLAGLLGGKQISGKEGGSLPIHDYQLADGTPVSLKLLSPGTKIDGSMKNLTRFLSKNEYGQRHGIRYIVSIKFDDEKLGFYRFTINRENYFSWLGKFINVDKIGTTPAPKEKKGATLQEAEEDSRIPKLRAHSAAFREKVISLHPMLGISTEIASKKLKDIETAAKFTSWGLNIRGLDSELMQGPKGIAAFDDFLEVAGIDPSAHPKIIMPPKPNPSENEEETKKAFADWLKKMNFVKKARKDLLKKAFESRSEDSVLSIRPFRKFSHLTADKPEEPEVEASVAEKVALLEKLATSSNPEDWVRWGDMILSNTAEVFKDTQFSLAQKDALSKPETTNYGNLVIGKQQVLSVMKTYGDVLREKIMPIYEELYNVTQAINKFFQKGELTAAQDAGTAGERLEGETKTLAKQVTEK